MDIYSILLLLNNKVCVNTKLLIVIFKLRKRHHDLLHENLKQNINAKLDVSSNIFVR